MSRNFLFVLLSLTVAGLLWGAHGDSPAGANAADNNENSTKIVASDGGVQRSQLTRVPYAVLRMASRVPLGLLRTFMRLPRQAVVNLVQSMFRLMRGFRDYGLDLLGYLASSERTDLVRVRRDVPLVVEPSGRKPTSRGINLASMISSLFVYPLKVAVKTGVGLLRFSPFAGTLNMISGLLSATALALDNPVVRKLNNVTLDAVNHVGAVAWNFTKSNVLPRLDGFANELKESGALPESLKAIIVELQTLYHIFKFLGMA